MPIASAVRPRLEALWWMARPPTLVTGFVAVPGWLAATSPPSSVRLAALVAATVLARAIANIVNDLLDEPKDFTTAPGLPLPSGAVTHVQALAAAACLAACVVGLLAGAAESFLQLFLGVVAMSSGCVLIGLYSLVKPHAIVTMLVTSCVWICLPLTGWIVAGGGWSAEVGVVFAYAALRGLAGNVFSSLRDVDKDPEVGNQSIAVRLGPGRAFTFGVALELLATLAVLVIAVLNERAPLGLAVALVIATALVLAYRATASRQRAPAGRAERTALMWPLDIARHNTGAVIVQSPAIGILTTAITLVALTRGATAYQRQVVGRGRDALGRAGVGTG